MKKIFAGIFLCLFSFNFCFGATEFLSTEEVLSGLEKLRPNAIFYRHNLMIEDYCYKVSDKISIKQLDLILDSLREEVDSVDTPHGVSYTKQRISRKFLRSQYDRLTPAEAVYLAGIQTSSLENNKLLEEYLNNNFHKFQYPEVVTILGGLKPFLSYVVHRYDDIRTSERIMLKWRSEGRYR